MSFDLFLGIDYSGAEAATSRLPGLQVYAAAPGAVASEKRPSPTAANHHAVVNWSRKEIASHLLELARSERRFLAGLDFCFSFPRTYFERYALRTWPEFLDDFVLHWPTHIDRVSLDLVRAVSSNGSGPHGNGQAPQPGARAGRRNELRLTERWTSSAKSVFEFDVRGAVAKSSHAGIPWLKWLRDEAGDRLHFWPFDGWDPPAGKSVIVEVYPSIFRNRYERDGRTTHERDASAVARWMADMAARGAIASYFSPPLTDEERAVASFEGWIFGVW